MSVIVHLERVLGLDVSAILADGGEEELRRVLAKREDELLLITSLSVGAWQRGGSCLADRLPFTGGTSWE
jgi:hypothetical protein